jgi:ribonuclease HI
VLKLTLHDARRKTVKLVTIYSDGACEGNPGPGGWAAVLQYGEVQKEVFGGDIATTNNRMEITGAVEALKRLKEPCEVQMYTDSEYLKNGAAVWIFAWKRKNWRKGQKPIKNADLWQELDKEASRHKVTWNWVRGHSGNPLNERCDRLAVAEIAKIKKSLPKEALSKALDDFKSRQKTKPSLEKPSESTVLNFATTH